MERPLDKLAGRDFRISSFQFAIPSFEFRKTEPNKPKSPKILVLNSMAEEWPKQTQPTHHTCYQLFTAILAPILRKFGWKRRGSLLGIRATPRSPALQASAGGLYQQTYDVL